MSAFELRTTLPCSPDAWEAESAAEWSKCATGSEPTLLAILKLYMSPRQTTTRPYMNALSRLLVLHGLMSIFWDMKRRDQTSLGMCLIRHDVDISLGMTSTMKGSVGPTAEWQPRLTQAYNLWKADFDTYCMNMTLQLRDSPSIKSEFTRFSTSTLAIYHAAHIVLNVEILDLQISAGARHIMGRPVSSHDYERSQRIVEQWSSETPVSASAAAWHAAQLLRDGVMNLEDWDVDQHFHYPWCLYLATITCWAFHRDGTTTGESEQPNNECDDGGWSAKSAMNSLISSMTAVGPEGLKSLAGKQSTAGLVSVMAEHLSAIRWAVVYEGMKVLRGLEPGGTIVRHDTLR